QKRGVATIGFDHRKEASVVASVHAEFPDLVGYFGNIASEDLLKATRIVLSPGVPLAHPLWNEAKKHGIPIVGDIELFATYVNAPVIAITGSNGKSTVTSLVAALLSGVGLRVCAGGNLGTPALDLIQEPAPDVYVLELSSFQLE